MRIAITADHNGIPLKDRLKTWLEARGHVVDDRAGDGGGEVVDYPPLCEDVCRRVVAGDADFAIVVGGSGSGEAIACNKIPGIRAALCLDLWVTRDRAGEQRRERPRDGCEGALAPTTPS